MQAIGDYLIFEPVDSLLQDRIIDLSNPPMVSFCIPTYNNADTLERCLNSINLQKYPSLEIIIVDGGSSDDTLKIAKKFTKNIFYDPGKLGSARQTSIDHAQGEILALFDSDIIIPHENWLKNAIKYFNYSSQVSTVWPFNTAKPGASSITRLYFNFWEVVYLDAIKKKRGLFGGGNALFLKKYFNEIGGIDKNIHWGEDCDWAQKFKREGYQVIAITDPLYHDTMNTLHEFAKKQCVGAATFTKTGFEFMGLSFSEVIYENFYLGVRGMIEGILIEKDFSWFYYPFFLLIRITAYSFTYLNNLNFRGNNG
jgi:glycosyltransferase involved in cell wall biosynthesis